MFSAPSHRPTNIFVQNYDDSFCQLVAYRLEHWCLHLVEMLERLIFMMKQHCEMSSGKRFKPEVTSDYDHCVIIH